MKLIKYMLLAFIMNISACRSQSTDIEIALKKCVNEKVNENIEEFHGKKPFDFYDFILEIEKTLITNKLLIDDNKESYLNLLKEIINSEKKEYSEMYTQQNTIMDNFGFFVFSTETIFNQCPYKVSVQEKDGEGKLMFTQGSILNQLMAHGYDNQELLKSLIDSTDEINFKKIVYRAPVILLVMINIDNKYNPSIKKAEEYRKGRIMDKKGNRSN